MANGKGNSVKYFNYGLAVSEEQLGDFAPVLLQGGLEKAIKRASELGFDNVEIHIRNPEKIDVEKLLEAAGRNHIQISAVGTGLEYTMNGLSFTSDDKSIRSQMALRFKEHIDLASHLNAVVFLGFCRGKAPDYSTREEYLNRLEHELVPIASYAYEKGVILAFEPIAFYLNNLLNTTDETLEFLKRPGLKNIQLLLDTHHMYIEDKDMEQAFRKCSGRIAHVHISDSNRRYPGSGKVDYGMVGKVLRDIGYDRAVSLEVFPYPNGDDAAIEGLIYMKSML